jgi:hypothetical protein
MSKVRLTPDELESLYALRHGTGCSQPEHARLEALGLVHTGRSRFGGWVKLTETGRAMVLARYVEAAPTGSSSTPIPDEPASSGVRTPGRAVDPLPKRRRRSEPAPPGGYLPPATSLEVGAPSQTRPQGAVKAAPAKAVRKGKA